VIDALWILCIATLIVAGVVIVMRSLRPMQRVVVLLGVFAVMAQVWFPPCTAPGDPRVPVGRHWLGGRVSYRESDYNDLSVDLPRQATGLLITGAVTVLSCALLRIGPSRPAVIK
jgi:hypothetical protein